MNRLLLALTITIFGLAAFVDGQSSPPLVRPYPIEGIKGYGTIMAGRTGDGHFKIRLARLSGDTSTTDFEVFDSIVTYLLPQKCGDNTIGFVTHQGACLNLVTAGPFPDTARDTVTQVCFQDSAGWRLQDFFLNKSDSLFGLTYLVFAGGPVDGHQCLIGKFTPDRRFNTLASLKGVSGFRPSEDNSELLLEMLSGPDVNDQLRHTVGVYDLTTNELARPLDQSSDTWSGCSLGSDHPVFYIKHQAGTGTNVWQWDKEAGEKQVTSFRDPNIVRSIHLEPDTLVCFVGEDNSQSSKTQVTRITIPLE